MDIDPATAKLQVAFWQQELASLQAQYAFYQRRTKEEILHDLELQMYAKLSLIRLFTQQLAARESAETTDKGEKSESENSESGF